MGKGQPGGALYQCVPNFSEGRRPEIVAEIAEAIHTTPGARLIDYSADVDHNRCVMTFLGDADAIKPAARIWRWSIFSSRFICNRRIRSRCCRSH